VRRIRHHHPDARHSGGQASASIARRRPLQALVTDPTQDRLLVVDVPSGHVASEIKLGDEPQFLAPDWSPPIVVSAAPGSATIVTGPPLRAVKAFAGFASAPAVAVAPGDGYAYLTDAGSGRLTVIGLYNEKILSHLPVGTGAHHLAFSPDEDQAWIALGEAAKTVAILSTVNVRRPHLIGRFNPGFLAHDLLFSPDGKQVWITSANTAFTSVFSPHTHRLLFQVPAGPPPQHVATAGGYAYITSGYGSRIEQAALQSGRVIKQASAPYGSFDLAARDGYVVTVSLFRGTIAIYNAKLRLLRVRRLAPSIKDVVLLGS
jgi:DNA-binding beta-propeller fold protein YncE